MFMGYDGNSSKREYDVPMNIIIPRLIIIIINNNMGIGEIKIPLSILLGKYYGQKDLIRC